MMNMIQMVVKFQALGGCSVEVSSPVLCSTFVQCQFGGVIGTWRTAPSGVVASVRVVR
jgi:hypothetical protein